MVKKSRTFVVMSKAETIPGEYANPTIEDAQLATNPNFKPNQAFQTREIAQTSLDPERLAPGLATDDFSYGLELRGNGTLPDISASEEPDDADKPRFMANIEACGFRVLNPLKLVCTGLTAGIDPNTIIYGEMSGAAARLLRRNSATDTHLILEPISGKAFLGGETLRSENPASGDSIGTVATGLSTIIAGKFGWYARPIAQSLSRATLDDANAPWVFLRQGFGSTVKLAFTHKYVTILAGTELTGATSGAKVRVIENCGAIFLLGCTPLAANVASGVTITSAGGATAVTVGGALAGDEVIAVKKVNATAFVDGEAITWTGGGSSAVDMPSPVQQVLTCQVISGTLRGGETLNGTGAVAAPTIAWIEQELVLTAAISGTVNAGTAITGGSSTATGTLVSAVTDGELFTIRRTSAANFAAGETLTGTGLGVAPTVESVEYTLNRAPRTGVVLEGATSGAKAVIVDPNQSDGYGVHAARIHAAPYAGVEYARYRSGQDFIYYDPAEGTLEGGEDLVNVATGDVVNTLATDPDIFTWQGKTLSLDFNRDGFERSMVGARGTARITGTAGETMTTEFRWNGRHHSQQDQDIGIETAPSGLPNYGDEPSPIRLESFNLGMPSCVGDIVIDFGVTNANRKCAAAPDGIEQSEVVGRTPTIEMTPETVAVGVRDWLQEMRDADELLAANVIYLESPAEEGNRFTFCAPNCQVTDITDEDRDGISVQRVKWQQNRSSVFGNDHCWILMD